MDLIILVKTIKKVLFPTQKLITGRAGRQRFDVCRQAELNK